MPQICRECGYEIHREDGETLLVDRRTWRLGYAMGMLALLSLILAVVGVLGLAGATDVRSDVPVVVLFVIAAGCASIGVLLLPVYRRRRGVPTGEVPGTAVIDRSTGVLRGSGYDVLAQLESIRVAVRIDWWTRGWMRLVVLTWPGGRRVVYRSQSRQRARTVAESLRDVLST